MADPKKPTRPDAWLTKQAMAGVLDVTVNYFDREVRRHATEQHVKRDGKRLLFFARGVLDAWYTARLGPVVDDDLVNEVELEMLCHELYFNP
ncbi:hypothetical protein [Adhaeretor mobilis]|uniref:Uncharacterized protein n=1 Tax=Adhaeretor mobilis TaxID=1930276 RepID=A0A517MTD7_9BACT|nr:hypothetical protein [Adhaeretor mobilis]QDS98150.1 hypothetical protein HG15A2_14230 [Adhaeretor mobilis]